MKIQPILSYRLVKSNQQKNNYVSSPQNSLNLDKKDSISFGIGSRDVLSAARSSELNILGRNSEQMIDIAESLHKCEEKVLRSVATVYDTKFLIFDCVNEVKSLTAYRKLSGAVNAIKVRKAKMEEELKASFISSQRREEIQTEIKRLNDKAAEARNEYNLWLDY